MKILCLKFVVLMSLLSAAAGCVSLPDYRPDLPEDIGSDGLVVGQVVGIGRTERLVDIYARSDQRPQKRHGREQLDRDSA